MCTMCQALASIQLYSDYILIYVITCCMHECWLSAQYAKPGLGSQASLWLYGAEVL
jgi:hypothetical protein